MIFLNESFNYAEFVTAKPQVSGEPQWVKPELRGVIVTIYVHMCWFIWLMTIEVEPVRASS